MAKLAPMTSIEVEITDPAKELVQLARHFHQSANRHKTIEMLAKSIGLGLESPDFLEVLAAIQRRIRVVEKLVDEVADEHFDEDHKNLVKTAAHNFRSLLHPSHAEGVWDGNLKQFLPENNITALTMFGPFARRHQPHRIIPDDAREDAIRKIEETIAAIRDDDDLEPWMKSALVSGLERLLVTLQYFKFFGHDAAIFALLFAYQSIATIQTAAEPTKRPKSLFNALAVMSAIATLFLLPSQAPDAIRLYRGWSNHLIEWLVTRPAPSPEQLLLSPPSALKPDDEPSVDDRAHD
jgi:hypothetical protein